MSDLPSGIVTFLFTDIEGSTRLWERDAGAMWAATARHNEILSDIIARHRGHHFKTIGDAYLAAFVEPLDAVLVAVAAQRAFAVESWAETGPIRVRMAIHRGEATPVGGDYVVAPCLNRLARLLSTGYGAQVLLSEAVRKMVEPRLPAGIALRDLGRHRLRDLLEPEQVAQLLADGLPDTFPPLKSLERHPTNLPIQPTPLVGRDTEQGAVRALIEREDVRLVTLTGVGGTGKTRLALQAAAELLETFEDGAFFVDLAPLEQPALVLPTMATALGVRESAWHSLRDALFDHLANKRLLLVLDNFEHLMLAAPTVSDLLSNCKRLKVLVTSRAPLRLRGEYEYAVPPLAVPDPRRMPSLDALAAIDAVKLFVQRAVAIRPDFSLTDDNGMPVAELCARLDGIPLAIELAAARIRTLEPPALLARLDRRLNVLTGGARDLPGRQRTLRAAIAWSHDLLTADEQVFFRRLAVFAGSGSIEAAEAVMESVGELAVDVLDGIEALIDQSLLRRTTGPDGEPRFAMLETLREFALERLAEAGEVDALQGAHVAWCLTLTADAEAAFRGPEQTRWLRRLDVEHDNVRAVLGWAVAMDDGELCLRVVRRLWPFWHLRGYLEEGIRWIDAALAMGDQRVNGDRLWTQVGAGTLRFARGDFSGAEQWYARAYAEAESIDDPLATVILLNNLGAVAHAQGHLDSAAEWYEQSLGFARTLGEQRRYATALANLGAIAHYRGDERAAIARYDESLAIYRTLGDGVGTMDVLSNLVSVMAPVPGQRDHARRLGEEALALARELGSAQGEASVLTYLAIVAETAGEAERAADLHEQSLARSREVGDRAGIAGSLGNLGAVAFDAAEVDRAVALSAESVAIFAELGDPDGVAFALETLSAVALAQGEPQRAARWIGAVDGLRDAVGSAVPPESRQRRERFLNRLHASLPHDALESAVAAGRDLALEQVRVEVAVTMAPHPGLPAPAASRSVRPVH
ncbi:MAG TPA: tetratricopeptide repeat protein [Thermomicrobiales bacterium]|nr:tetratricopeptide repeat protein [Thermomicrobiales bacterium]